MYGEQPLYAWNVELQDKDGQVQDGWHKQIGLRELDGEPRPGRMGRGILSRVNGVKIFAMGADYIARG